MLKNLESIILRQAFYVLIAFAVMVALSSFFMSKIVRNNLTKSMDTSLNLMSEDLASDLLTAKLTLSNFSASLQNMLTQGESIETIRQYASVIENNINSFAEKTSDYGLFAYICKENALIANYYTWLTEDYEPTERKWYKDAIEANGKMVWHLDYNDIVLGKSILVYSMAIYDDNGTRLGVVAMRINAEEIGKKTVEAAMLDNTYGMLIDENLKLLAHNNHEFIGRSVGDKNIPLWFLFDKMKEGLDIREQPITNYKGIKSIIFLEKQSNGWYIGAMVPKEFYYKDVKNITLILSFFGTIFASLIIVILFTLNKAKTKSDRENKYKSAFLSNMTHELRTPLSAVIGMVTIGKTADNIEKKDYCFTKIENASKHLLGIINDILDLSKIEENKLELSDAEFDFEKMLQRVTEFISFKVGEKQQEFTVKIDKNIPKNLYGDDLHLSQVITNLLSNSVKFTPEGGKIELNTHFLGEEDGICEIQVDVKDNGIGVKQEAQETLFQPFQQGDVNTTRKFGGTGLGLTISKFIVELMGGKIWIESELGHGATFSFTFKMKRAQTDESPISDIKNTALRNLKILVVDDNEDILIYFKEILLKSAIECDIAGSAERALEMVREKGYYNVYFVDWKMPEIDGIELSQKLKECGYADDENSIIIMISSVELSVIEEKAKNAGVNKFLSKPLFPSDIMNILSEFAGAEKQIETMEPNKFQYTSFEKNHILVAEDIKVNCEILSALFEPTKLKIDFAENGIEAVEKFANSPAQYDLILMDVQMPQMDGLQATKNIRAMNFEKAKTIPIISMTANVFKEDIEKCLEAGMNDHIGKPIDFTLLMEKMRKYLSSKKD